MNTPSIGLRIMHNGRAIELLYRVGDKPRNGGQIWRAKMLFVEAPDEDVTIKPTDVCKALHEEHRRGRAA